MTLPTVTHVPFRPLCRPLPVSLVGRNPSVSSVSSSESLPLCRRRKPFPDMFTWYFRSSLVPRRSLVPTRRRSRTSESLGTRLLQNRSDAWERAPRTQAFYRRRELGTRQKMDEFKITSIIHVRIIMHWFVCA